ncbi:MAG: acetyl-CoA carboxylase biotin carboxyl carrier protein [Christensenellales bacterium]|jgi:acetyl-CoA carboxylase biotin carboxyl carrier protein
MDLKSVLDLIAAVENTGWKVFEVKEEQFSLRLEREGAHKGVILEAPGSSSEEPQQPTAQGEQIEPPEGDAGIGVGRVVSPLVGVFRELPGQEVTTGQMVKKGEAVCIVEAMKLMNEIQMPEDGMITWRAVDDGEAVEFGQLLFNYRPAD